MAEGASADQEAAAEAAVCLPTCRQAPAEAVEGGGAENGAEAAAGSLPPGYETYAYAYAGYANACTGGWCVRSRITPQRARRC